MSLKLSEPVVIAESSFVNEPGVDRWGYYQFPTLDRLLDGRIAVTFHINADSALAYGKKTEEPNRGVSTDDGLTWERMGSGDPVAGILLPSGERLLAGRPEVTPVALDPTHCELPAERGTAIGSYGQQPYVCYRHHELPVELQGVPTARMAAGANGWEPSRAALDDPGLLRFTTEGVFPVTWWGDVHLLPDGGLLAVTYPCRIEGEGFDSWHCGCYRSDDHGLSWSLQKRIPYRQDPSAEKHDGFTEPASIVLPDGEILAILRTTDGFGDGPLYQTRSRDGGRTWSEPEIIRPYGVMPRLLRLGNGTLVLSTGRPGAELLFSTDGRGESWSEPQPLVPITSAGNQDDSCGYTSLLGLTDDTFLVAYSWFKQPTEDGHTRKAILVRRVQVTV